MIVKLLAEHHLEFLRLKGGCTGSSASTLVKESNCWKSHAAAQIYLLTSSYVFGICVKYPIPICVKSNLRCACAAAIQ